MAKSKRIRWADVYQCEISAQAKLITSVLAANGLQAKVQRKKSKKTSNTVPYVRVKKNQAEHAKVLLSNYNLSL
ncbi:MAG: hypothetical protein ACC653_05760 [Gammaproteobacteria bacterium]